MSGEVARNYADIARRYAELVVAGDVSACRWVQLACQRQLNDLARFKGKASPYRFNPVLSDADGRSYRPADNLCAFIERLPEGFATVLAERGANLSTKKLLQLRQQGMLKNNQLI